MSILPIKTDDKIRKKIEVTNYRYYCFTHCIMQLCVGKQTFDIIEKKGSSLWSVKTREKQVFLFFFIPEKNESELQSHKNKINI